MEETRRNRPGNIGTLEEDTEFTEEVNCQDRRGSRERTKAQRKRKDVEGTEEQYS